jgi:hypothetical protein
MSDVPLCTVSMLCHLLHAVFNVGSHLGCSVDALEGVAIGMVNGLDL